MLTIIRVATDPVDCPYTELAYHALLHLAHVVPKSQSGFSASLLTSTLVRLGAKSTSCSELGQVSSKPAINIDDERRERTLCRIVSIVTAFARYVAHCFV